MATIDTFLAPRDDATPPVRNATLNGPALAPTKSIVDPTPSPLGEIDPERLRMLRTAEVVELAADIRALLVTTLADTGGHLGSNLGVVEVALAVHRVFRSPDDAVVWDTGHQTYVHKLVTGRAGDFKSLRQAGGLSGYPNRAESHHDLVENSHASTGLSYAYGLASARALAGNPHRVVAIVGDGSLTGGLAYEALNNIGFRQVPVVIVLNDNGRSYAPTVSRLTTAPGMDGGLGHPGGDSAERVSAFFGALGLSYIGPVDGHDIEALEEALRQAASMVGPAVVHVHTVKGRGYGPAEEDHEKHLHDVGPFDPATGSSLRPAIPTFTEAFGRAIVAAGERCPNVVAVTAAMGGPTGLTAFRDRFPDRYFDVGIAEQHAVTAAAGMAMGGLRPVVAIYSTFLNRAWDQVLFDVALHRLPVVFCIDRAGVTGDDGPSHHGIFDLALLTKVPGLTVFAPSSYEEVGVMLEEALRMPGPAALRWPKTEAPLVGVVGHGLGARRLHAASGEMASGEPRPVGWRPDVCLIGVGKMAIACQQAAGLLEALGLSVTVWDARVAAPLDESMIEDAGRHRLVLTAEDGIADGGVGASIASCLRGTDGSATGARPGLTDIYSGGRHGPMLVTLGLPREFLPHGRVDDILALAGLDGTGITAAVLHALPMRPMPPMRPMRAAARPMG